MERPMKFWMVYVTKGNSPTFAHPSKSLAMAEAFRLCSTTKQVAFVLEATSFYQPPEEIMPVFSEEFVPNDY